MEGKYLKGLIQQNISKLKLEYRDILNLKYNYELKDEEISEVLGLSVSAVKSRLHRAKAKLRTVLGDQVDFFKK